MCHDAWKSDHAGLLSRCHPLLKTARANASAALKIQNQRERLSIVLWPAAVSVVGERPRCVTSGARKLGICGKETFGSPGTLSDLLTNGSYVETACCSGA